MYSSEQFGDDGRQHPGQVTRLLRCWRDGDDNACSDLFELLYPQLRAIAEHRMRGERSGHTLQPTALVNEFFVRMAACSEVDWQNRAHFLAVASRAMRRLLIDYARRTNSERAGGKLVRIELSELRLPPDLAFASFVEINQLLEQFAEQDARAAQLLELRCFGGLTHAEAGEVLGFDERTMKRDWTNARSWIIAHLRRSQRDDAAALGAS